MKVSGFTFVRNAIDLYYPVAEAIRSALPLCDEFIVAAGDSTDATTELIRAIDDPKIKIIETVWDRSQFVGGATNAQQTNIALNACSGDWAIYVQADEVLHEDDYDVLHERMTTYLDDRRVDGFLFEYRHFFADYDHYMDCHPWYRREVRLVRNRVGVQSWHSAQGFRRGKTKIQVVPADARIHHYGWVRPPLQMSNKARALATFHIGADAAAKEHPPGAYDYGRLFGRVPFRGTHPAVMRDRIAECDWQVRPTRTRRRHDRVAHRVHSWIENNVLGFRVGEHRNYILVPS